MASNKKIVKAVQVLPDALIADETTAGLVINPAGSTTTQTVLNATQTANRTISLPDATDTLVGKATTDTLTNKSIDATTNTISNIADANVKSAAAIAVNKLAATTASKALASDASGFITASATTSTELGYVSGVTSAIQTQLGTKVDTVGTIGSSPAANAATIAGTTLTLQPADGTHPGVLSTTAQTIPGDKAFQDGLNLSTSLRLTLTADSSTTGGNALIPAGDTKVGTKLTNASLSSIAGITAPTGTATDRIFILNNATGNTIAIQDSSAALGTAANRILTGLGASTQLLNNSTIMLTYDSGVSRWRIIGTPNSTTIQSLLSAKGSVISASASSTPVEVSVGTNGQVLSADSTQASGLKWVTPATVSLTAPTIQKFTSGSGTYTKPGSVLYLRVRMVGGGGGGASGYNGAQSNGSDGTATTFGSSLLTANGGSGGNTSTNIGGAGGTASLGSGPIGTALQGGSGGAEHAVTGNAGSTYPGANGASSPFGGGGGGGYNSTAGQNAPANSGAGGGGGGTNNTIAITGAGGGAGGFIDAIITSPSSTYSYAVGSGGAGGSGASQNTGGNGGSGYIEVTEYYQ